MKVLMFTWEFPPLISGGLGMACYGMVKALLSLGVEVDLVLPTREIVYFPLRQPSDVDTLPAVFFEQSKQMLYSVQKFASLKERLEYIGISEYPESYFQLSEIQRFAESVTKEYWTSESISYHEQELFRQMTDNLVGEEDLIRKVQEFTMRADKFARVLDYDLIHVHDWLTYPAGMLARRISGKPLVAHVHATEFDRAVGPGDERVHKIEHSGMRFADKVIAVSQYTAQMIMSRYRIDSGKIRIVHNAFSIPDDAVRDKERIFKGPVILFLGRITLQKGPDYFMDIAHKVLQSHPEARFIMAGTGDMGRKLLRRSASLKLRHRFLLTGFLDRKQVERILRAADIYVLPSVSEPFGISPLEAMSFGITSIISKQSGVAEIVNHAFKIDFWDTDLWVETIKHLISNPDKCVKMGIDGMHEVNKIQWNDAAVKIRDIYNETLTEYSRNQD